MEANFDKSVMTYLFEQFGNNVQTRLKTQYRANEKIMMWSNEMFYENELNADKSVRFICVEDILEPGSNCYTSPLVMLDTLNAPGNFYERRSQTSFTNYGEAKLVEEQVRGLIAGGINPRQIGVISPYRSQVRVIKELLCE
jgi:superfamily I DNA and/or RNA helicase